MDLFEYHFTNFSIANICNLSLKNIEILFYKCHSELKKGGDI